MKVEFTPAQDALRAELREYFAKLMTPELRAECEAGTGEGGGPGFKAAMRQMGRDGWIGLGWPKEMGGRGVTGDTIVEQVFREIRAFRIYDGPTEVHKWSLAKRIRREWKAAQ